MPYLTPDEWIFTLVLIFVVYGVGLIPRMAAAFVRQMDDDGGVADGGASSGAAGAEKSGAA